jgi:hypothetical protein
MKWDIYVCEKDHLIIVERRDDWPDDVQLVFLCDICRELAHYDGSVESLRILEEATRRRR